MIQQCLEDAGQQLQEEVDKLILCRHQEGKDDTQSDESINVNAFTKPTPVQQPPPPPSTKIGDDFIDDDDDAMMAAFYAKQKATQDKKETLPMEAWARTIVAAAAQDKTKTGEAMATNTKCRGSKDNKVEMKVQQLYQVFLHEIEK